MLPEGWAEKGKDLNVIKRYREIKSEEDLMYLGLFHTLNGTSILEMSAVAKTLKIGSLSDVAFMKNFEKCGDWFAALTDELCLQEVANFNVPEYLKNRNLKGVDTTVITEKGKTKRSYNLHYQMDIFKMSTVSYKLTDEKCGEKLTNFDFKENDIVVADRAYGTIQSISHCKKCGADFIIRLRTNCFNLYNDNGKEINLLDKISHLKNEESMEFTCGINAKEQSKLRICVKKKSEDACKKMSEKLKKKNAKKQYGQTEEAKALNNYIIVATSIGYEMSADEILETYRLRWQIEIFFKRLKSLMDVGELPKKREKSAFTWLLSKILIALLVEKIIAKGTFSPNEF